MFVKLGKYPASGLWYRTGTLSNAQWGALSVSGVPSAVKGAASASNILPKPQQTGQSSSPGWFSQAIRQITEMFMYEFLHDVLL